ncbi:MAG: hypothetical protein A4E30_00639 [Methanomassiliicoccales archaeon PtaB.Bin215]|nr:MAG: hypothetical protein A4E30_00639 [Methanomassiliicoccales archaeon PtaB.Bin215]
MPSTFGEWQYEQVSVSPRAVLPQLRQEVNSGLKAICEFWVFWKVLTTNAARFSAGGLCSPNQTWVRAPASTSGWNRPSALTLSMALIWAPTFR